MTTELASKGSKPGYSNASLKTDAVTMLQDLAHELSAREHKRFTLSDTLSMIVHHYRKTALTGEKQ